MNKDSLKEYIIKMLITLSMILVVVLIVLGVVYFDTIKQNISFLIDILMPFIYGGCLAYILTPLCNKIQSGLSKSKSKKICKHTKILSITLTEIIFITLIILASVLIIPQSLQSAIDIAKSFPSAIHNAQKLIDENLLTIELVNELAGDKLSDIESTMTTSFKEEILPNFEAIVTGVFNSATSVGNVIIDLIMAIFINIFALYNRENFATSSRRFIQAIFGGNISKLILEEVNVANKMFSGFFFGKIVDSTIIGLLCFIILTILNIPYALLVSVIVGITNVIPIAGPFIGAIPGIVIIFSASPLKSLYFIVIIIIIQQLDGNYIGPKCIGNATNLSTFWVLFAIIFFGGLWGIVGMVVGVPLLAVIFDILNKVLNKLLDKRHLTEH